MAEFWEFGSVTRFGDLQTDLLGGLGGGNPREKGKLHCARECKISNITEYKFSKTKLSEFRKYCRNPFYNSSFNSKIEFIRNKLLDLGHVVNITPEIYQIPEYSNYRSYNTSNVDYKYDPSFIKKIVVVSKESSLKPKQLTANQSIILLDKLGFFAQSEIENLPQTKQANIISQITGLNEKNINKRISKLEQNQKEISKNYQKDIDKINKILDDLE